MRLKLTMKLNRQMYGDEIPVNYQYPLQGFVYKVLTSKNRKYAHWLHENGYNLGGKRYKMFTFSNLSIKRLRFVDNKIKILSDEVQWYISFATQKASECFIEGIWNNKVFEIADKKTKAQFVITNIEVVPEEQFGKNRIYDTMSPICVSYRNDNGRHVFLSPLDERYGECVLAGLKGRYERLYGHPYAGETYCRIQPITQPHSTIVSIKEGTEEETKVKGFKYKFVADMPQELFDIALSCGLGEKNAMGFGMIG